MDSNNVEKLNEKANICLKNGLFDSALDQYSQAIELELSASKQSSTLTMLYSNKALVLLNMERLAF